MRQAQPPIRRIAPRLHQIRIHDSEKRVGVAMEHDPVDVSQNLERRGLECCLADTFTEWVGVVPVYAGRRGLTALELVNDEGG